MNRKYLVPVPGGKVPEKKSGAIQVHVRYIYEILNIIKYLILNIHMKCILIYYEIYLVSTII